MVDRYINVDLNDKRIGKIADAISNKTCKKILDILSDKEMSGSDISEELKLPLNTITYNLDLLKEAGLVESGRDFFWSEKGRRIVKYKLANKKIIISPKARFTGLASAVLISGMVAFFIKIWENYYTRAFVDSIASQQFYAESGAKVAENAGSVSFGEPALWFFLGSLIALIIFILINWRKK